MVNNVSFEFSKAFCEMLVMEVGIMMLGRPVLEKAEMGKAVMEVGRDTEVRAVQPPKTNVPMVMTLVGMTSEVRPVQSSKAAAPMEVTVVGMKREDSALSLLKANAAMKVRTVGMLTEVDPLQAVMF